ncbi:MAG: hypothetical protein CVU57_16230 [Deltaproteobacteria bacterium HGW-Deltaproteobacteria-15]|nr:MAG: hypothetical protein CVU57_16230 [Deltaproteobacteria bacterium HGW-Deltaproteobacteria-15]
MRASFFEVKNRPREGVLISDFLRSHANAYRTMDLAKNSLLRPCFCVLPLLMMDNAIGKAQPIGEK